MLRWPRELRSGTPQAAWLNAFLRACRSLEPKFAPSGSVEIGPRGTAHRPKAANIPIAANPTIRRLRIIAGVHGVNKGDYISCEFWDGTTAEGSVNVAKPWLLRYSTLDGQTRGGESFEYEPEGQTRTVTHSTLTGGPESLEVLWPQYRPLDEIYAMRIPAGTGVMAGSQEIEWLDLNVDARTFVHPYQLAQVCVGGVDKTIVVRRGDVV